jgi:hypothetical protein
MKILVEVPEGFSCHNCGVTTCDSYDPNHFGMKPSYCPLANAKEAVEADIIGKCANMFTVRTDGSPVRLYAVKEDK